MNNVLLAECISVCEKSSYTELRLIKVIICAKSPLFQISERWFPETGIVFLNDPVISGWERLLEENR